MNGLEVGLGNIISNIHNRGKHWLEIQFESGLIKGERPPQPRDYFYAGWAGQCPRYVQATMKAQMPYSPMKFRNRKAFEYGISAHERYQKAIKLMEPKSRLEEVIKFSEGAVFISGKADIITFSPIGIEIVVEIKTLNGEDYKSLTAPKEDHLCQWTVYSHHLKLPNGLIVYESKDDTRVAGVMPDLKIYEVVYSESLYQKIIRTFQYIVDCNKKGEIAEAPEKCPNPFCDLKCKALTKIKKA